METEPTPDLPEIETQEVTWNGHTLTIPVEFDDLPIETAEAYLRGDWLGIATAMIGPEQWAAVKADGLTIRQAKSLVVALEEAFGAKPGESKAS